ncbi:MAG TPA: pilin, partial [Woeseiaceae bacterium]|nr:pilin [Woeseiaceae bacterium]
AIGLLSLPTAEELARIEALFLESMQQEDRDEWQKLKDELKSDTGVSIEELLSALGPELVGVFDAAGDYGAIRLRDRALFEQVMDALALSSGVAPETHRAHGKTFYHWSMPGDLAMVDADTADEMGPAAEIMLRQREHIYWVQDGDFLYVASVPQPLFDRVRKGANTRVDRWLEERQHIDTRTSFLLLTGTSRKLPMRLYHIYIELLQLLADLSETDIDVWNMPTADQLSLATQGVVGFTFNLGDPYVSASFTFESNPAEVLLGGGGAIAALGIVAAIAIPAYQDYTVRARVSEGYYLAQQAQDAVAGYHAASGGFPPPSIAAAMGDDLDGTHTESIRVMPGSGIIVVSFFEEAVPDGGQLFFEPVVDSQGVIEWVCSGTLPAEHMPADCRDNEIPEEVHGGA